MDQQQPQHQQSSSTINTSIPSYYGTIFIVFSRLICIAYIILAGFTFPEIQKLHNTEYTIFGGTYLVPIAICEPGALRIEKETTIFYDINEIKGCRTMDVLINSCAASLILSGLAVLIYVFIDLLSRCHHGPFINRSSVSGMGIFLLFIVFQASSTTWALAEESDFWSDYMSRYWKEQGLDKDYPGVDRVHTYCNETLLWATGIVGACACSFVFLEAMSNMCCGNSRSTEEQPEEDEIKPQDPNWPDIDIETGKQTNEKWYNDEEKEGPKDEEKVEVPKKDEEKVEPEKDENIDIAVTTKHENEKKSEAKDTDDIEKPSVVVEAEKKDESSNSPSHNPFEDTKTDDVPAETKDSSDKNKDDIEKPSVVSDDKINEKEDEPQQTNESRENKKTEIDNQKSDSTKTVKDDKPEKSNEQGREDKEEETQKEKKATEKLGAEVDK